MRRLLTVFSILTFATGGSTARSLEQQTKPLKVYILAGQSNMVGQAPEKVLIGMTDNPTTKALYHKLVDEQGKPRVFNDVYIAIPASGKEESGLRFGPLTLGFGANEISFGPELAFGAIMREKIKEPILIIKTAWGGKSLSHDFRPPSAGEWTPPPGHPDLDKTDPDKSEKGPSIPIPTELDVPKDLKIPYYTGAWMGIAPITMHRLEKMNGVHPLYLVKDPKDTYEGDPFRKGDLLLGVDGQGFSQNAVKEWREAFHGSKGTDWVVKVTRWRDGVIETFDFDLTQMLEGGKDGIAEWHEQRKRGAEARKKERGAYYRRMMAHIHEVLGDIKAVYPDYDAEAGYELSGFVWFHGWNDYIDTGTYPNSDKPRGYEQYSWLLSHFIGDVRKELNAPGLPFVVGVLGVGGVEEPPKTNLGFLQQAMAAPADDPEFKGTVAAVHTGKYWDHKLDELAERERKVRTEEHAPGTPYAAIKAKLEPVLAKIEEAQKNPDRKARDAQLLMLNKEKKDILFTAAEQEYMNNNLANGGYHYLGSAKTYTQIGKAFAEALIEMEKDE